MTRMCKGILSDSLMVTLGYNLQDGSQRVDGNGQASAAASKREPVLVPKNFSVEDLR